MFEVHENRGSGRTALNNGTHGQRTSKMLVAAWRKNSRERKKHKVHTEFPPEVQSGGEYAIQPVRPSRRRCPTDATVRRKPAVHFTIENNRASLVRECHEAQVDARSMQQTVQRSAGLQRQSSGAR